MLTHGTTHLTESEFADAFRSLDPGATMIYATGCLASSADYDDAKVLSALRSLTREKYKGRDAELTQRATDTPFTGRSGGRQFEYRITKK